ncbi:hypothetical protein HC891_28430 [Candidatus Gracilibacteria bacterium]|nr:hypothetical protein [Candidatus Gracilibacteria bacterium]
MIGTFFLRFFALALLALGMFTTPIAAHAQEGSWRQRSTDYFDILYQDGSEADVENYVGFVDVIYDDMERIFGFATATPLTLRLYPTSESYFAVNPLARNVPGVVAHADFRRRELVVILERTRVQSEEEIRNNVRHELTHIIAADLSGNRLNTGFQEGIAQYVELPSRELEARIIALRLTRDQGRLLPWSAFDDRDQVYGDPTVGYPQSLSVVAFLVERDGFAKFRAFLDVSERSSGYRSALERAYGVSASDLEAEWADWLPSYIDGGYKRNALATYDLSYAESLLAQGNYAAAQSELQQAAEWLQQNAATQPPELVARAQQLLDQSDDGVQAERLADAARTAIEQAEYEQAQQIIAQARALYALLGDTRQDATLDAYTERIVRVQSASNELLRADNLARTFRYPQARAAADSAAVEFAALGDAVRLENALAIRNAMDLRQRLAGAALVALGLLGVTASLFGRWLRPAREAW